jgi:uncharacterized membrane protein
LFTTIFFLSIRTTIFSNIGIIKGNRPFVILLLIAGVINLGAYNFSFVLLRVSDLGIQEDFIPIVFAIINLAHRGSISELSFIKGE